MNYYWYFSLHVYTQCWLFIRVNNTDFAKVCGSTSNMLLHDNWKYLVEKCLSYGPSTRSERWYFMLIWNAGYHRKFRTDLSCCVESNVVPHWLKSSVWDKEWLSLVLWFYDIYCQDYFLFSQWILSSFLLVINRTYVNDTRAGPLNIFSRQSAVSHATSQWTRFSWFNATVWQCFFQERIGCCHMIAQINMSTTQVERPLLLCAYQVENRLIWITEAKHWTLGFETLMKNWERYFGNDCAGLGRC